MDINQRLNCYKNNWGIYPWFFEDGEDLIYQNDLTRFKERFLLSKNKLFFCVEEDKEYITIKYKSELFKVKPSLFKMVKSPLYVYGDIVELPKFPNSICEIEDICWHDGRQQPYYFITANGERKNKIFYESDFYQA